MSGGTWFASATRRVLLSIGLLCLCTFVVSRAGHAVDPAVDLAVEAFAVGGMAIGVPVGPTEKALLKPLVQCAIDGRHVLECGKEALIQSVLGKLPGESRAFATCIAGGGDIARCASSEMIKKLPPQARPLVGCIAQGRDVSDCARQAGTAQLGAAEKSVLEMLGNLKADGRLSLTRSTTSIQNIINVADGIAKGNWEKVANNGSKAIAKYVIRSVLTALLSQAGSALAGPVIDGLVENRMDLAINLVNALKSGDPGRIARAMIDAYLYLGLPVVQACSLLPQGAVKEAVCGLVGDILREISDAGGKVVDTASDEAEKRYNDLADFLTGNKDDCGARWTYYDAHFAFCKHHAAIAKNLNPDRYAEIETSLDNGCRAHFRPCSKRIQLDIPTPFGDIEIGSKSTEDRVSDICNPVRDKFRTEVDKLRRGLKDQAAAFARDYAAPELKLEHGEDCEARSAQQFIIDCIGTLNDRDRPASASCRVDGKKLGIASSHMNACTDAAFVGEGANLRLSFRPRCTYPVEPPAKPELRERFPRSPPPVRQDLVKPPPPLVTARPCPAGMARGPSGSCECLQGTVLVAGRCVQPCPPGMAGTPPYCRCAGGTVLVAGRCVQPCPPGMTGTPPYCRCAGGTVLVAGRCVQPCPPGMTGTPPYCRCAGGTVLVAGRCVQPCPPGMTGTPPNCRCPGGTILSGGRCTSCPPGTTWSGGRCTPASCPPGMIGRPPHCHRPVPPPTRPPPPVIKPPPCPLVRTCVQWGRGAPGTFAGPCIRYEMRPQCPSNVR